MNITLPDGSVRALEVGSNGLDLANDIGPGLAKAAIAVSVNGIQKDLCDPINEDSEVSIITIDSDEGLEIMRHTLTAQVLARAVKNIYPDTKLAIGPTIKDGFYYDFEFSKPISPDDLEKIEKEMHKIINSKSSITKKFYSKKDALKVFKTVGESYKQSIIEESDQEDNFQLYYQDDDIFVDLCRGPHLPSLSHIGVFKLTKLAHYDYKEINTPQVVDRKLWEASGHWDKYRENMFITEIDEEHANEKRTNALKPMNCPCHVQVYNQGLKSYRDLPIRYAEFGSCHRYEASGTMHGLMRVRGFTQDDGHIFCTEEQIESETKLFIELLSDVYQDLGFESFDIKLSTRPETRVGSDETWDRAEQALENAIKKLDIPYEVQEGDGAFYGPKLDFVLTDAIGREWQCGTFQADFNLPDRLDAEFVADDGAKHRPVLIHRAVLGSFERFIGVLIENYSGRLPLWLAPSQVVVCSITSDVNSYAQDINKKLLDLGIRTKIDIRNEKISYKIREHSNKKVPNIVILGKQEAELNTVTIRKLGSREKYSYPLKDYLSEIIKEAHK